jgi:uncharacterized protein YegL
MSSEMSSCWGLRPRNFRDLTSIALVDVECTVVLSDLTADVNVAQTFQNRSTWEVPEATYRFPLDAAAALYSAVFTVGPRVIRARLEELKAAKDKFEKAGLVEQQKPDVFALSLGTVPANTQVRVELKYRVTCDLFAGATQFLLPSAVAPRYSPRADQNDVDLGRPELVSATAPASAAAPSVVPRPSPLSPGTVFSAITVRGAVRCRILVSMPSPIVRLEAVSHPSTTTIERTSDPRNAVVSFIQPAAVLDGDFKLLVQQRDAFVPRASYQWCPESKRPVVQVAFCAPTRTLEEMDSRPARADITFLLDCSGSMNRSTIVAVRRAMHTFLSSMHNEPGFHRFNLLKFGSSFKALWRDGSRPYSEETLTEARAWIDAVEADMGGTEILPALRRLMAMPERKDSDGLVWPQQFVVLTDGEVDNTEEVVAEVRANAGRRRVHTIGIGSGASEHLVKSIARVGNGLCCLVKDNEKVEEAVAVVTQAIFQPADCDVRISITTPSPKPGGSTSAAALMSPSSRGAAAAAAASSSPKPAHPSPTPGSGAAAAAAASSSPKPAHPSPTPSASGGQISVIAEMEKLKNLYVQMVKDGTIVAKDGEWVAVYGPGRFKVATTSDDVLKGSNNDICYSVQHCPAFKVWPNRLPALFAGERYVAYVLPELSASFDGTSPINVVVELRSTRQNESDIRRIVLRAERGPDGPVRDLMRLAVKARIQELEDELRPTYSTYRSNVLENDAEHVEVSDLASQQLARRTAADADAKHAKERDSIDAQRRAKIVRLSTTFQVSSCLTAFVRVDGEDNAQVVSCPDEQQRGSQFSMPLSAMMSAPSYATMTNIEMVLERGETLESVNESARVIDSIAHDVDFKQTTPDLSDLLRLQSFAGSWSELKQLQELAVLHLPKPVYEKLIQFQAKHLVWLKSKHGVVCSATHTARLLLRALFEPRRNEWRAADLRAARWVAAMWSTEIAVSAAVPLSELELDLLCPLK